MRKSGVSAWVGRRTTFELLALLGALAAMYVGLSWLLFTWSTHTLAVVAVFLLVANGRSSK